MPNASQLPAHNLTAALLPFAGIVFLGHSAVGVPLSTLPVELPVEVRSRLGYGTAAVGSIIGLSAAVTLLTRQLAGSVRRDAGRAGVIGGRGRRPVAHRVGGTAGG